MLIDTLWKQGLRLLPKTLLSRLLGKFATITGPKALVNAQINGFSRIFHIDLTEAKKPPAAFSSLQEFFTRELKEGVRPIDSDEDALVAPCDGFWGQSGEVTNGLMLQIKGKSYRTASLLGSEEHAAQFEGGSYATFYLSPRDYHRFHTPMRCAVQEAVYFPGYLWPVNAMAVRNVDQLFCVNERVATILRVGESTQGTLAMVAVGACVVGKIRMFFDETLASPHGCHIDRRLYTRAAPKLEKGDQMGCFEFGSTIVLIAAKETAKIECQPVSTVLRIGTRIGKVLC